jgi:nitrogen fixation NifU-like protein
MADLRNLYQEVILDHNRNPRNFGELECADHHAHGDNPLCGDSYDVSLKLTDAGEIEAIGFHGAGCAISKAAASMMTQRVKGKTTAEAEALVDQFRLMLTGKLDPEGGDNQLGHLKVFMGVASRPERIKCAVLPWHTLRAALEGREEISTEGDDDPLA